MKIIAAPNAFKGSLSALDVAKAIALGVKNVIPTANVILAPVADGGDGLVDVVVALMHGEIRQAVVAGPMQKLVTADFCYVKSKNLAILEMALASGLALLPEHQKNPVKTTTFGTGELILAALDLGVDRIEVGLGGSATNDGGIGMASALGVRFLDKNGKCVEPVGGSLGDICKIDTSHLDPRIKGVCIEGMCDVDNPFIGKNGAAYVYAPQKGASFEQVKTLDAGLSNLADIIQSDLGINIKNMQKAGAAGGLAGGLYAFLGAKLRHGVDIILDIAEFNEKLIGADLVITGEGQIDFQTAYGKAPAGVGAAAKVRNIPCIAIAGSIGDNLGDLHKIGIDAVFSLCPGPVSLKYAMTNGEKLISCVVEQAVRCFLSGQ